MPGSYSIVDVPQNRRSYRRPEINFHLKVRPFWFQPCALMPVLPGETLKSALFQIRAVTDPIRNPLVGWWLETYWFYVKHRDLAGREDFTAMMLDPNKDMTAYDSATDYQYFHFNGTETPAINWTKLCLTECIEWYGRYQGETASTAVIDGLPVARLNNLDTFQSAILDSALHVDDVTVFTETGSATLKTSEIEAAMRTYELLKQQGLMPMTYEQFLESYGIKMGREPTHKPELIRYTRDWQYPTNSIDTSTGAPTSAVSWSIKESISKDRFFQEPGFILGVQLVRPKTYRNKHQGGSAAWMNDAYSWLPAVLSDDPRSSLKEFVTTDGPLDQPAANYWVDMKDYLLYGEQFLNWDPANGTYEIPDSATPGAALSEAAKNYPVDVTELRKYFVDFATTSGYLAESNTIRSDGRVNFNILGAQVDTTPVVQSAKNV